MKTPGNLGASQGSDIGFVAEASGNDSLGDPSSGVEGGRNDAVRLPSLGLLGWVRWAWRQLTSMRTALMLLLLLAVAAVPGSVLPQRNIDASRVADFLSRHASIGPWLDRLSLFDVYASPWFAAVYLLLTASLVGCVVPRTRAHWRASRTPPPKAPAFPHRLPVHITLEVTAQPSDVADAARRVLRKRRYRLRDTGPARQGGRAVSAQRGGLRETGNLVFHTSLLVVIVAIGARYLWGWRGDVIVPAGSSFTSTASGYGTFSPGPFVDPGDVPAFRVRVDRMDVSFEDGTQGPQLGAPRDFIADTTTWAGSDGKSRTQRLTVNGPLSLSGTSVFLLGNGYAPTITVRDRDGRVLYREATPFLPQDNNYRSVGAVKVPAASPKQLAFSGLFLPTAIIDPKVGPTSVFPDARAPALVLTGYEGELFPGGRPQSVYSVNTTNLDQLRQANGQPLRLWLNLGQTVQLPGGRGSITFERLDRFAGLSVRYDPGKVFALIGALSAATGLVVSLTVRRRRVFVTATPVWPPEGGGPVITRVVVAGISRGHDPGLPTEVERVAAEVRRQLQGETDPRAAPPAASAAGNTNAVEHDRDERPCRSTGLGNGRHASVMRPTATPHRMPPQQRLWLPLRRRQPRTPGRSAGGGENCDRQRVVGHVRRPGRVLGHCGHGRGHGVVHRRPCPHRATRLASAARGRRQRARHRVGTARLRHERSSA